MKAGFPTDEMHRLARYIRDLYGTFSISCKDYDYLLAYMHHDKKNATADKINFTLLKGVGDVEVNCEISEDDIKAALDIYCDEMGI